jgi:hypothetical protein
VSTPPTSGVVGAVKAFVAIENAGDAINQIAQTTHERANARR